MIMSKDYFAKGEVEGGVPFEVANSAGEVVEEWTFIGAMTGRYTLTLDWGTGRESKTFDNFASAIKMSRGYWAKSAVWHTDETGKRRRVIKWQ